MKIVPMLVLLYIMLSGVMIFDGTLTDETARDPYTTGETLEVPISEEVDADAPGDNAIWLVFYDPTVWSGNTLFVWLIASVLAISLSIFVAAVTKSDVALLAPVFVILLNAGIVPIIMMYNIVNREFWGMACMNNLNHGLSLEQLADSCADNGTVTGRILAAIIVGPFAIAWFMACIEWWTQRPTS